MIDNVFLVEQCSQMNISGDYATGFAEGESAFTFSITPQGHHPSFSLRQNYQSRDLLEQLQLFWGVGRIYDCKARPPTQKSCYFRVTKKKDLLLIIDHFTKFPLHGGQKIKVFEAWRKLVDAHIAKAHIRTLALLAKQLTSLQLRPRGQFQKWQDLDT